MPPIKPITVTVATAPRTVTVEPMTARGSMKDGTIFEWNLDRGGPEFQTRLQIPGGAFRIVGTAGDSLGQTVFPLQDDHGNPIPVKLQAANPGPWLYVVFVVFEVGSNPPSVVPIVIIEP